MTEKRYYSTGEVSKLLNISRATVSRKFDSGVLAGKKNPITGERMISHGSLAAFMKEFNIPFENLEEPVTKFVLCASTDESWVDIAEKINKEEKQIALEVVSSGYDALVRCSQERPDLFIIDAELNGIHCGRAIESLQRQIGDNAIKYMCLFGEAETDAETPEHVVSVNKGLWSQHQIIAKIKQLLGLPSLADERVHLYDHKRHWPRVEVNLPARLEIFLTNDRETRMPGKTYIKNISVGGAYLSMIDLESGMIPVDGFRMMIYIEKQPLKDMRAECKIMRLQSNGGLGAGVEFVDLQEPFRQRIGQMV